MKELTLKEISSSIKTGKTPPSKELKYYNGEINWYTPSDLTEKKVLSKSSRTITSLALEERKATLHKQDTLLVGCIGDIGKIGICKQDSSSNQQITGIYPIDEVDVSYLYYWFKGNKKKLASYANNAVVPILNNKILGSIKLPVPPLEEQKKIAAILEAADDYRQKTKALIDKYDQLTQSLFLDMFGDPVTNPKGWSKRALGDVSKMKAGSFVKASEISKSESISTYPCFGGNGIRGFVKTYTHEGSYVLIGRQGALCGNVKLASGKFHATEHAVVCDYKLDFNPNWMLSLLDKLKLNQYSTGAAQPGLNVGTLNKLLVIFPPLSLQNQFAERVAQIEKQKQQAQSSLVKAEELFSSLLQRAFKGELK